MSWSSIEFHNPWMFLLLLPAALVLAWTFRSRRLPVLTFPSVARFRGIRPTLRHRLHCLIPILHCVAVIGLVTAAARPREGDSRTVVQREGIAIQMVLDRSGSMEQEMMYGGERRRRIDIVRDVFLDFVVGDEDGQLEGRTNDLVGLTTFARFTEESCPLVALHEPLITTVKNLSTVAPFLDQFRQPTWDRRVAKFNNHLNKTAIGDGLYRAVLSLVTAEEDFARGEDEGGYKIEGKVIIILTDGENNAGMDPIKAGRYAAANGVRIYYIVFRELFELIDGLFTPTVRREIPAEELLALPRQVAEPTGGRAYVAKSGDQLREIYSEIDALERTDIGKIEFLSYHERFHVFLLPAIACLVLATLLGETIFRRSP